VALGNCGWFGFRWKRAKFISQFRWKRAKFRPPLAQNEFPRFVPLKFPLGSGSLQNFAKSSLIKKAHEGAKFRENFDETSSRLRFTAKIRGKFAKPPYMGLNFAILFSEKGPKFREKV
jgi:hypothetical protein